MPNVIDPTGKVVSEAPVPAAFTGDFSDKANAVYRAVHRELSNRRAGTASTLRRDEVRGGGKKPWKQKGTGRARQGSTRSPQWRHGGVVFGPLPRSYVTSLNKKERRAAFVAVLADRFATDAVTVLDASGFDLTKTKDFATLIFGSVKAAKDGPRTLVVYGAQEVQQGVLIERAGRNLQRIGVTSTDALDVKDVLGYTRLFLTRAAYDTLAAKYGDAK